MDRASQLGTLLGVPGGMGFLASPGPSCPGEGWSADVNSSHVTYNVLFSCSPRVITIASPVLAFKYPQYMFLCSTNMHNAWMHIWKTSDLSLSTCSECGYTLSTIYTYPYTSVWQLKYSRGWWVPTLWCVLTTPCALWTMVKRGWRLMDRPPVTCVDHAI